ncbi:MAG: TPM domain-containing protein [Gammaproteobacteria bacterium]
MIHARSLLVILWGAWCLVFSSPLWGEVPIPPLTARIIDQTGTLSAGQRLDLENKLQAFENAKGSQIAVLIVPTTQPEAIEQYSMRVVEQWRLGRKGVDDGALLVVAKDDRKLRIEVGYGLEGVLTDASSKRIISEVITPLFKAGEFYEGLAAGVDRMIRVVEGEPLPPPEPSGRSSPDDLIGGTVFALLMAFTVGSVVLSIASVLLPRATARLGGAALNGGVTGAIAWSLTKTLGIALVVAALGFVIALVIGSLPTRRSGRWSSGRGGGFGGNGGGFGGGGGGGGGFSGGGGGFGGGGASGSW